MPSLTTVTLEILGPNVVLFDLGSSSRLLLKPRALVASRAKQTSQFLVHSKSKRGYLCVSEPKTQVLKLLKVNFKS